MSNRPLQRDGPSWRDTDVWMVEPAGTGWGEARNLWPAVNSPRNEYMPSVDREGNLYFERCGVHWFNLGMRLSPAGEMPGTRMTGGGTVKRLHRSG